MATPPAPPSYYAVVTYPNNRNAIFYVGETPSIHLSQATPTGYYVKDLDGNTVSSGSVSSTTVVPTAPGGGWLPGWYRVYFTGAITNDANYGPSYGATNFVVIKADARFATNPHIPPDPGAGQGGGEAKDYIFKGMISQTSRMQIGDASNPTFGADNIATATLDAQLSATYYTNPGDPKLDHRRPRPLVCQFPNRTWDRLDFIGFCHVLPLNASIDGSKVFVTCTAGTSSGQKITVYYPDTVTVVETFDNLGTGIAAQAAVNGHSAYIKAYSTGNSINTVSTPTAIGNAFRNGVVQAVAALYPQGITRYEGPANEPLLSPELLHTSFLFKDAVKTGNPNAQTIGPTPVEINPKTNFVGGSSWTTFLAGGGQNNYDEIAFHDYNSITNGDLNLGRYSIEAFLALLASYGVTKPLWQTEATMVYNSAYGVYHPRRSKVMLMMTLLWEQYGVPKERNIAWYDKQHGFWAIPSFFAHSDTSFNPHWPLYRTLAEETFGLAFHHRVDMGCQAANAIWLGSVYTSSDTSIGPSAMVFQMTSYMPGATVDLTITGTTANITYVDGFGNTATAAQSSGRVTIPTSDLPVYVRLPAGVTATVYQVNDWGAAPPPSISALATADVGGTSTTLVNDNAFMTYYALADGVYKSSNALPEAATLTFPGNATFQRVIVFCGGSWQNLAAFTAFTVDTWDGAAWTTQQTVDVTADCTSFAHGTYMDNANAFRETYWKEQWIFDVKFPSPVTASKVRCSVSAASYGGEADAASIAVGGQGAAAPRVTIQEIMVLSASIPGTPSAPAPANTTAPTLVGMPRPGIQLTCPTGVWTGSPTAYAYQWKRDGSNIATGAHYVVTGADLGHALSCTVTASNAFAAVAQSSNAVTAAIARSSTVGMVTI